MPPSSCPAAEREIVLPPANVLELLAARLAGASSVFAAGPDGLVRAVATACAGAGVPCQVALEAPMACGYGACYGCAVRLGGRLVRLCVEGPVVAGERGGGVSADLATRVGDARARASGDERVGHARSAGRARRRARDRPRARAARHQDRDAARARGQRGAARVRGRGRHAQLDRPAQSRPRRLRRDGAARGARARPAARRLDRRLRARRLRAGLPPPRRRGRHRGARAQRLLPERQERLHLDRQRSGRDRGGRARLPCRDAVAAVGQALAQRRRPGCDRAAPPSAAAPMRWCSRTRCAGSRSTTGRSSRCSAASPAVSPGPALKPVALAAVHTCREACDLPLVGVGGIASGWDALEFLVAGASAVQVGSAAFREPLLARRIREELATLLARARPGGRWGIENNNTRLEVHVFPALERIYLRFTACAAPHGVPTISRQ